MADQPVVRPGCELHLDDHLGRDPGDGRRVGVSLGVAKRRVGTLQPRQLLAELRQGAVAEPRAHPAAVDEAPGGIVIAQ